MPPSSVTKASPTRYCCRSTEKRKKKTHNLSSLVSTHLILSAAANAQNLSSRSFGFRRASALHKLDRDTRADGVFMHSSSIRHASNVYISKGKYVYTSLPYVDVFGVLGFGFLRLLRLLACVSRRAADVMRQQQLKFISRFRYLVSGGIFTPRSICVCC